MAKFKTQEKTNVHNGNTDAILTILQPGGLLDKEQEAMFQFAKCKQSSNIYKVIQSTKWQDSQIVLMGCTINFQKS